MALSTKVTGIRTILHDNIIIWMLGTESLIKGYKLTVKLFVHSACHKLVSVLVGLLETDLLIQDAYHLVKCSVSICEL